ncbi:DUF6415 family natural product biosynthesis protein [Streptomyces sp. NPDC005279]|uniref:DUF6415 family natural product biosynthesis protein n=1 Tax=Streptomyces sp. NPDC005279 TaxID=3364712 RepID=UPI0036A90E63
MDVDTMRTAARQLLAEDAELPAYDDLEPLTLQLRGHVMLLIPEVETLAFGRPRDDVPRTCALACIGEARIRLDHDPRPGLPRAVAHAQRLSRSVNALLDHVENLRHPHEEKQPGR